MALGAATDYTELQLENAGFGFSPVIPGAYTLHISTAAMADDATGAVEFAGDTYAPVAIPGWTVAALDPPTPSPGSPYKVLAVPTADVVFPTPTAPWWDATATVYPYLWDGSGVLWYWKVTGLAVDATAPLKFLLTGSGPKIKIGWAVNQGVWAGTWPDVFLKGTLDTLTAAAGAPSYTFPSLFVGMADGSDREPNHSFFGGANDPTYTRKSLDTLAVPAHSGGGRAFTFNNTAYQWKVGSPTNTDTAVHTAWDTNMQVVIWDSATPGAGNVWFRFPGSNSRPNKGAFLDVGIGALQWQVD